MLARFRPPFARAKRSRIRGAVSTWALWLPHGAFGLVPPRHGDRRQMDAPIPVTPNAFSNPATLGEPPVVPAPQRRPLTAFATASQVLSQRPIPRPCPRRRLIIAYLERASFGLDLRPDAPPGDEGARGWHPRNRSRSCHSEPGGCRRRAQPNQSAPQFPSSQAVICGCRWLRPPPRRRS